MAQLADDEKQQQQTLDVEGEPDIEFEVLERVVTIPNYGVVTKQPPDVDKQEWFNCSIFIQYMVKFDIMKDFIQYRYSNLGMIIDCYNYNASVNGKSINNYLKQYGLDLIWFGIVNDSILIGNNEWQHKPPPTQARQFWSGIFQLLKDRINVKNTAIEKELLLYKFDEGGEGDVDNNIHEVNLPQGEFQLNAENKENGENGENKENEVLLLILAQKKNYLFIFCCVCLFFFL